MANPNALFLLADHIKLSLLERQRTKALDLLQDTTDVAGDDGNGCDAQDGQISRSLDQFRDGLEALQREQTRLESNGEAGKALTIADALPSLQKQLATLTAQFQGAPLSSSSPVSSSRRPAAAAPAAKKAVRFQDKPLPPPPGASASDLDLEAQRSGLFNQPYHDEPDDSSRFASQDNPELLQTHARIIADQDAQLDVLGASISRQRELSMQIGDELDSHVAMLEESERLTDRHQNRIDRARNHVGRLARNGNDCKQMGIIVFLIVILILLIVILK
ncbi:snare complex subunit [Grosmannia clavigera kw1407]|uniref:Snare complex subunit n=1 Tax=Grosmannia clavigera (strain kw1407 / UAMH 11150) TaxID=655863 RepID=F0XV42_GROCL|nr:snare complex subunit [Grosmannia clavigera kw1407]EFW98762.1 snare complex subunit [Grosmannia clavigera kw1407]